MPTSKKTTAPKDATKAPAKAASKTRLALPAPKKAKAAAAPADAAEPGAAPAQRTVAVSGSQSGLGLAIRRHLEAAGVRVIGIDLPGKGAEVEADLSKPEGRKRAVQGVNDACGGTLQGLVANAGIDAKDSTLTFAVNYDGAVDLLEGLQPALARAAKHGGAAAVVTVSHAILISPGVKVRAADALLDGKPGRARLWLGGGNPYPVSKLALARWIRREAPGADWAGAGIVLNGVCPGAIETPMLEKDLKDKVKGPIIRAMPKPLGRNSKPEDLAGIYEFLLSPQARFIVGQLITADGGVEATWRGDDWPRAWDISTARFLINLFGKSR
ncbi:MAG TPA: SDR family oxidoreductase [Rubrivivax sp.]|nr:SDR family oxidoreductase [Rubrivivax sp.]HPO18781.1 SDR family oxidoreductase [Rubrivivax sp.]